MEHLNRDLEIALISGALAIIWAYLLGQRIKENTSEIGWPTGTKEEKLGQFWAIIAVFGTCEIGWIVITVYHFALWL